MRCNCCDRELSPNEVVFNSDIDAWEMCSTCLDTSFDAAFSNGFTPGGYDDVVLLEDGETVDDEFI